MHVGISPETKSSLKNMNCRSRMCACALFSRLYLLLLIASLHKQVATFSSISLRFSRENEKKKKRKRRYDLEICRESDGSRGWATKPGNRAVIKSFLRVVLYFSFSVYYSQRSSVLQMAHSTATQFHGISHDIKVTNTLF